MLPRITGSRSLLLASALVLPTLIASPLLGDDKFTEEAETCLSCHGDKEATKTLADGSTASIYVDVTAFEKSAHEKNVPCSSCHPDHKEYPHPEVVAADPREFQAKFQEACRTCHSQKYNQYQDSVHHRAHLKGDLMAPYCFDCHGSHDVKRPKKTRTGTSATCATCHSEVYAQYEKSVHGKALIDGLNTDAPVCTDCHNSHAIEDPTTLRWRVQSPEVCSKCHSDKQKMAKYGLSTDVLKTYLDDFHGMSAELYGHQKTEPKKLVQVCFDCHGIHDITKTDAANSKVLKANLVQSCRKCHPDASENLPSAWLSHYRPSLEHSPMVYAVRIFYRIFIPFIIGGLILQMALHVFWVVLKR